GSVVQAPSSDPNRSAMSRPCNPGRSAGVTIWRSNELADGSTSAEFCSALRLHCSPKYLGCDGKVEMDCSIRRGCDPRFRFFSYQRRYFGALNAIEDQKRRIYTYGDGVSKFHRLTTTRAFRHRLGHA